MSGYFDANCQIGRYNHWSGREPITPEALLAELDHYGVHEALVVDNLAREYHPIDGNARVLQLIAGHPRLHAAWGGLPPGSRELPPSADLVSEMEERGVRALFLHPQQYHFSLDDWCVDGLLGPLAERQVPVFVCPNTHLRSEQDQTDWPGVVRLCRAFPSLPVVVSEYRISYTLRTMYQAMEVCPNLHIDISALWLHHLIEFVCREWSANRLLFGSGLPRRDPAAVLGQLNYSAVSEQDLAAIAGGNLRRLLSWGRLPLLEPAVRFPAPVDELHDLARNRRPLNGQGFLCAHGHVGRHSMLHIPDASIPELIAEMDRFGIERGIVFANGGLNSDEVYDNDLVAGAVQAHPERFTGFVAANLNRSPEEMRREMERGFSMGMVGIKLHPNFSGYDTYGPHVEVACAFAHERGAFILNHDWGKRERIRSLCIKYPNACFMTGHTSLEAASVVDQVDNLYIGSCPLNSYGSTEEFVEKAGAERILFGSDLSWDPIGWGMGPVLYARIPVKAKRLILGGNLSRLLKRYGSRSGVG